MIVRWGEGNFLLVYLVDGEQNAQQMVKKLQALIDTPVMKSLKTQLSWAVQKEKESMESLIKRAES
jgi:hypothetical protein